MYFEIRPVSEEDLEAVLRVYQGCEDFLALGPVATASREMVLRDLENSKEENGIFCGIHAADGRMVGVVDFVLKGFQGDPHSAFLSLLMIDSSFRNQGIGQAVFKAVENEIRKDRTVTALFSGVQVNNPPAVKFWQRNGFAIISEPKLMPDQTTAIELRKDLLRSP
jgi:ribosomal protein S18 acetylase RimI-like enzyme